MKTIKISFLAFVLFLIPAPSISKDLPKIAIWDLRPVNINASDTQRLTSVMKREIRKLGKYEVYSQENVGALAGWTAQKMELGCTDPKCLTVLGQSDISRLISGRVEKDGARYTVFLNVFDTKNAKSEKTISEFCESEAELIVLLQMGIRKLLGEPLEVSTSTSEVSPPEYKDFRTGMEFIFVRGGCFEMGDVFGDGDSEEKPVHEVCVDGFYLGKYPVTQGQWEKVMGHNPSSFKGGDNPVEMVTWGDVQRFIERLNNTSNRKYRLPTEAEWEYAARSGGKKEKYAGTNQDGDLAEYAWYLDNSESQTHPVGKKRSNGLGLYDMSGNVWEWCADWYDARYYQNSPKYNPSGPRKGTYRVLRGGSWYNARKQVRTVYRIAYGPAGENYTIGFRLLLPYP